MTDNTTLEPFKREERYIVIKRKHLAPQVEVDFRKYLRQGGIPTVECVVVEHDWPEYETVWSMIEARCNNTRPSQSGVTQAEIIPTHEDRAAREEWRKNGYNCEGAWLLLDQAFARHRQPLLEAVKALGVIGEGYCFCSSNRIGDDSRQHEPECADLRAIIEGK